MTPPSLAQQKGFALAPMPFAVISLLSSSYVIYYLLHKERQNLKRLYHRLVLALNFALIPLSLCYAWSTFAVPEGTPNYYGASGTIQTCTAQGFITVLLQLTVPIYYASLSLQAWMGMKYNFREENYIWIEKYIHIVAYCPSIVLATVFAATQNFNPSGSGCYFGKYPRGCEADSDIPCQRGKDIKIVELTVTFSVSMLYFLIPPSVVTAMYCRIKKLCKNSSESMGMQQVRDYAEKEMMKSIAMQISLYLFSFWFTFMPTICAFVYKTVTGEMHYDLTIAVNCVFALQGFIMAVVYFSLQKLGKPDVKFMGNASSKRQELTVGDIRASAVRRPEHGVEDVSEQRLSFGFNIFDGVPDEGSPWARFLHQDDYDGDGEDQGGSETTPTNNDGDIQQTRRLSKSLSRISSRGE